jgi:hypothetical protein
LLRALAGRLIPMLDLIFVTVTVVLFAVSLGYIAGCDRLK